MKQLVLSLLVVCATFAQTPIQPPTPTNPELPRYRLYETNSSKITVQSCSTCDPAYLETVGASCSADSTLTFSINGTAATTTAATLKPIGGSRTQRPPDVFTNSNVGAGTTVSTMAVAAATATSPPQFYDISAFMVTAGGPASINWSVGTSSGSCTFQLTFRTKNQ